MKPMSRTEHVIILDIVVIMFYTDSTVAAGIHWSATNVREDRLLLLNQFIDIKHYGTQMILF